MLHKDLNLNKKAAKLVPHQLTADHCRQCRLFCQDFLRRCRRIPHFLSSVVTTDEAWFYLIETRTKQENMQWLAPTDNCPQEPRRPRNCKKLMVVPFFDRRGIVHLSCLINTNVNAEVFHPLLQEARQSLLNRRIQVRRQPHRSVFHMDNAPAHRARCVRDWLEAVEWSRIPHPPYSPDLSPCDFFLFPLLKKRLRGHEYGDLARLTAAVQREISEVTLRQWRLCFIDWIRRCLLFNGNYFEGMKHLPH